MGRREQMTIGELTLTGALKRAHGGEIAKFLKPFIAVPAAKVANRYFASAAMHNGVYAVANGGLPGDSLAHNVTCAQTAVDVEDTNGTLTVTGIDSENKLITEDIIPDAGVTVEGLKAFRRVDSIVGSGWAQGGAGPDNIVIGFGDVIGIPDRIPAAADIVLVGFDAGIINAPVLTVDKDVLAKNTVKLVGDATKVIRVFYLLGGTPY
jgi:hypothetical protein